MSDDCSNQMGMIFASAYDAINDAEPSEGELSAAVFMAGELFGKTHDDETRVSHVRQALAAVRIRNTAELFINRGCSLSQALSVMERSAQRILSEYGAREYPFSVSEDHHPLAQETLKLLIEVTDINRLIHLDECYYSQEQLVRAGARLMRITAFMEEKWFEEDCIRGRKSKIGARRGHMQTYGNASQRRKMCQQMRKRFNTLREQYPRYKVTRLDQMVGKEFHRCSKTVERARLEKEKK